MEKEEKITEVLKKLQKIYGGPQTALKYRAPVQLLVAVILSAQTMDKQVNTVTPALFKKFKTIKDFATCRLEDLQQAIQSIGLYKNKAKNIKACCQMLLAHYAGEIPRTMAEMVELPGVGRKTANVVLGELFGIAEGVCVDTHVARLSERIGLSKYKDPIRVERDLMNLVPQKNWMLITHVLINHGRQVCVARKPKCGECVIAAVCEYGQQMLAPTT